MSTNTIDERIWCEQRDAIAFFESQRLGRFFPTANMSFSAQMNSLVRFAVYFAVLLLLVRRSQHGVYLLLFTLGFTFFLWKMRERTLLEQQDTMERMNLGYDAHARRPCKRPTANNPFMNVLMSEYRDDPRRPPACDVQDAGVKAEIRKKYSAKLYRDVDDVFETKASDITFNTAPITTIPNDQHSFANWLYKTQPTCKERTIECWKRPLNFGGGPCRGK